MFFSIKKEGKSVICDNMDDSGRHYAKWDKLDRKRQILYGIIGCEITGHEI